MTPQPGSQSILIHILPNILRSKVNQTIKFGQLTECNMGNIFFLKIHKQNAVEKLKLVPDLFLEDESWAYLWINGLKLYTVCFCCMANGGLSKYNETKLWTACLFSSHIKLFWKIKRGLELVIQPYFPHNFWRKMFALLCSINWPNFTVWLPLLCEILGNMCIAIVCKPGCDVMNFEANLIFIIKLFFLHNQNFMTKT